LCPYCAGYLHVPGGSFLHLHCPHHWIRSPDRSFTLHLSTPLPPQYQNIPAYLEWLYWASPCSYATAALLTQQFGREEGGQGEGPAAGADPRADAGAAWFQLFDSPLAGKYTECCCALAAYLLCFRVLCFLSLRYMQKEAR
jgi:hypothetical protein